MDTSDSSKSTAAGFETKLRQMKAITEEMEKKDIPLEDLLTRFKEGIRLAGECAGILKEAERDLDTSMHEIDLILNTSGEGHDSGHIGAEKKTHQ